MPVFLAVMLIFIVSTPFAIIYKIFRVIPFYFVEFIILLSLEKVNTVFKKRRNLVKIMCRAERFAAGKVLHLQNKVDMINFKSRIV